MFYFEALHDDCTTNVTLSIRYMYTEHDLGNHYPNATGHNDGMDEMQPLEVNTNISLEHHILTKPRNAAT